MLITPKDHSQHHQGTLDTNFLPPNKNSPQFNKNSIKKLSAKTKREKKALD